MDMEKMMSDADSFDTYKKNLQKEISSMQEIENKFVAIASKKIEDKTKEFFVELKDYFMQKGLQIIEKDDTMHFNYKTISLYLFNINYDGDYMSFRNLNDDSAIINFRIGTPPDDIYFGENLDMGNIVVDRIRLIDCYDGNGKINYDKFIGKLKTIDQIQTAIEKIQARTKTLETCLENVEKMQIVIYRRDNSTIYDNIDSLISSI